MTFYSMDPTRFNIDSDSTREKKAIFKQLVNNYPKNCIKHGFYKIKFKDQKHCFILTHDVLIRPRKNDIAQKRLEILKPNSFADGGGSDGIHKSVGVLIPENDLQFKEKSYYKTRICKYIEAESEDELSSVSLEAEHTRYNKDLHCKNAILDKNFGYIVMRRMRENNLYELIEKIEDGEIQLTIEQRLELTYKILRAFKKRVLKVGLIHGDIKSENIMVDWINSKATIIDYGFARTNTTPDWEDFPYGSFGFIALEVLRNGPHTQASDLYALAMALAELWGDTSIDYAENKDLKNIEAHIQYVLTRTWDYLFTGIQIEDELKSNILSVFKNLSNPIPSERNLEKAINDWEILQNNYLKQKEPNPHLFFSATPLLNNNSIFSETEKSSKTAEDSQECPVF